MISLSLERTMLALLVLAGGCTRPAPLAPSESVPTTLATELSFASVLAHAPMQDTARIAGVMGGVVVVGLLNQTPPCFGLTSAAVRTGARIVIRLSAEEVQRTCATFAAGAFDYDVALRDVRTGTYDVEVVHRTHFRDGRVVEGNVAMRRVEVQ